MGKGVLLGMHADRVGGKLSEEVRVTYGVPQGSILGPFLFLASVNDIWRNTVSNIRLFADDCVIYEKLSKMRPLKICRKFCTGWGNWQQKMR
jgi:hypothetical protein